MPQFSEQIRNITRTIDSTQQIMKKSDATIKPEQYCFTQGLNTHGQVDKQRKGKKRDTKPVLGKKNEHKDWYSKQIDTTAVWNSDSNNSNNQAIFSKCV